MNRHLESIKKVVWLTNDPTIVSMTVVQPKMLADVICAFQKHIAVLEKQIAQCFKAHSDAWLFSSLPGAEAAMAPRLLVAFGTNWNRYRCAANLQKYSGIAPVLEQSGSQCWTH
jgi:hypothetical protein